MILVRSIRSHQIGGRHEMVVTCAMVMIGRQGVSPALRVFRGIQLYTIIGIAFGVFTPVFTLTPTT